MNASSRTRQLSVFWILVLPAALASGQAVIYVDDTADGAVDGSSWCSAYPFLQDALAIVTAPAEIRVAQGVYRPDQSTTNPTGTGDRTASFVIPSGVTVRGGFLGCGGADPDEHNASLYETILDGDLSDNDAEEPGPYFSCCFDAIFGDACEDASCSTAVCAIDETCCTTAWNQACADLARTLCTNICDTPSRSDNSYHVVMAISVTGTTLLDGFTISGGHANGPNAGPHHESMDQGSGLNNFHGQIQVHNCTFVDNWADNHGALNDHGGATVTGCNFRANHSGNIGGGLYVHHSDIGPTFVSDCVFEDNTTVQKGGGMYNRGNFQTTLTQCNFVNNRSGLYGGGLYHQVNATTVTACSFNENHAVSGGGLYASSSNAMVSGCTFEGNTASDGAGLYVPFGSNHVIEQCTFIQNQTTAANPKGAAIFGYNTSTAIIRDCHFRENVANEGEGGAVFTYFGEDWRVERCTFVDNTARIGGGLYWNNVSGSVLTDSMFLGNTATGFGGGAYLYRQTYSVQNCLFSGNTALNAGGAMINAFDFTDIINCTFSSNSAAEGGGIFAQSFDSQSNDGQISLYNSILWGNSDDSGTGQSAQIFADFDATPIVEHSCVQGWNGTMQGSGNMADDPLFVDANGADDENGTDDDNLRVAIESPVIDAGLNAAVPADLETDLDGDPRIVGGTVDMGAYESAGGCGNEICEGEENPCTCPDDCGTPTPTETDCNDAIDNDCDLAADCMDADCDADTVCLASIPAISQWGIVVLTLLLMTGGTVLAVKRAGLRCA